MTLEGEIGLKLILGSGSPRRKDILNLFNLRYEIEISKVEESINESFSPQINSMYNAYIKGADIKSHNKDCIVLAADTIVQLDGKILLKPRNEDEAVFILKSLSGKSHSVITGFAILSDTKKYVDYVETKLMFKEFDDIMISKYVNTGEPLDKAGAYGIQGMGSILVEKITGDYFNVVGLPISKVADVLKTHFDFDLF